MIKDKINRKSNITSVVELFLMFLLLLIVIVVITMACMTTRQQSLQAHYLTEAVIYAENTAEVTATATDADQAAELIGMMDGVKNVQVAGDKITADLGRDSIYTIEITLSTDKGTAGTFTSEDIQVFRAGDQLYELHTGSYNK